MRNIHLDCDSFFAVEKSKQYKSSNFCFDNLTITAKKDVKIDEDIIDALVMRKVEISCCSYRCHNDRNIKCCHSNRNGIIDGRGDVGSPLF